MENFLVVFVGEHIIFIFFIARESLTHSLRKKEEKNLNE